MSLYTPPSTIRRLILEAENLTLTPNADATKANEFTASSTPEDVALDLSTELPGQGIPGGISSNTLTMPNVVTPPATLKKTVINRDIILSQLAELKSVITNYEKQFDGDDLTPEDANIYISSLLSTLVFHAEKLNGFMESESANEPGLPEIAQPMPEQLPSEEIPSGAEEPKVIG